MKSLYDKKPAPTYFGSMISVVLLFFLGVSLIAKSQKGKESFYHITSPITSIADSPNDAPEAHEEDIRYLQLKTYPVTFELTIGNKSGFFNPRFERIDELKTGDIITIYFENIKPSNSNSNRKVQFIDKNEQPYFIRGRGDIYVGCTAIGFSILLMVAILTYRKQNRTP